MTLKQYLKQLNSICWYPSVGYDLRETLYLSKQYANYKGWCIDTHPDCFIITDYAPYYNTEWIFGALNGPKELFNDGLTSITAKSAKELQKLYIPFHQSLVVCHPNSDYGRTICLDIDINSNVLGNFSSKLVFVIIENTAFGIDFLLKNGIKVDYIVHVRYGEGPGGGGRSNGMFTKRLLSSLQTKYYISERNDPAESDIEAFEIYGETLSTLSEPSLEPVYFIPGYSWSDHGDVVWYKCV